jgi:hypothetical protein
VDTADHGNTLAENLDNGKGNRAATCKNQIDKSDKVLRG